ncbi:hypothetical protein EDB86DRAFT_542553 [Lactarius hatsudake]|nr:hypothetical protein EDB86DRAFT_542553 [Lactarius hatsudake]
MTTLPSAIPEPQPRVLGVISPRSTIPDPVDLDNGRGSDTSTDWSPVCPFSCRNFYPIPPFLNGPVPLPSPTFRNVIGFPKIPSGWWVLATQRTGRMDFAHQRLSVHLSELVENALSDLVNSKCIVIGRSHLVISVSTLTYICRGRNGRITSQRSQPWHITTSLVSLIFLGLSLYLLTIKLSDVTVEVYTLLLKERPKLNGLLEVVSSSAEFELVPIRRHEIACLSNLISQL